MTVLIDPTPTVHRAKACSKTVKAATAATKQTPRPVYTHKLTVLDMQYQQVRPDTSTASCNISEGKSVW